MSSLETIVMYGKKGRLIVNKIDQQKWADMGYKLMPEAKTETGSTGTGNANIVFDFATCSDEQIAEFAVKAGLSANVKKRETIIAKLTEAGFMPEAKTETGSTGTGNANIVFDFATCSDEQIAEFAVKAGLSANVKKRETIIAKLTEAGFMPEAKTE